MVAWAEQRRAAGSAVARHESNGLDDSSTPQLTL